VEPQHLLQRRDRALRPLVLRGHPLQQRLRALLHQGRVEARARLNPFAVDGGPHGGGPDGADLYVGAEPVTGYGIANCDRGLLGGLAVYNPTLPGDELVKLATRASIVPA